MCLDVAEVRVFGANLDPSVDGTLENRYLWCSNSLIEMIQTLLVISRTRSCEVINSKQLLYLGFVNSFF